MLSEFPWYVEGQHAWIVGELALVDSLLTEIVADLAQVARKLIEVIGDLALVVSELI